MHTYPYAVKYIQWLLYLVESEFHLWKERSTVEGGQIIPVV